MLSINLKAPKRTVLVKLVTDIQRDSTYNVHLSISIYNILFCFVGWLTLPALPSSGNYWLCSMLANCISVSNWFTELASFASMLDSRFPVSIPIPIPIPSAVCFRGRVFCVCLANCHVQLVLLQQCNKLINC